MKNIELSVLYVINIISIYIMSIFILHSSFYRHHKISLIINLIFLIVLVVIDQITIFKDVDWVIRIIYITMELLNVIFYSFEDIYGKVLLSIGSISPYILLFYRGIIVGIMTLIFSFVFIFVEIPDENGNNSIVYTRFYKIYENKLNILYTIGIALVNFIYNIHIFFIIDKFSPSHFAKATILDNFSSLLIAIFKGNIDIQEFISKFIFYLLLILTGLIYNEIIILNFCGLQKYTKFFLEKKSNIDMIQTTINENNIEIENEIIKQEGMNNAISLKEIPVEDNYEPSKSSMYFSKSIFNSIL